MAKLSVNVNKIALLRNSRGENKPCLLAVLKNLINLGVTGITVHPRPDGRHILYEDVREIQRFLKNLKSIEFNVEGFPSTEFLQLMREARPAQCTLVPDGPNALTSNAGWAFHEHFSLLQQTLSFLKQNKIRSSVFLDPFTFSEQEEKALQKLTPDRVEFYTKAYADSYHTKNRQKVINVYIAAGKKIQALGIGLNAGHDLNQDNLGFFLKNLPSVKEVSIGHALICSALYDGLEKVCKNYLKICAEPV